LQSILDQLELCARACSENQVQSILKTAEKILAIAEKSNDPTIKPFGEIAITLGHYALVSPGFLK